jgi:hypothetical protein
VTLAGRPRSAGQDTGTGVRSLDTAQGSFERIALPVFRPAD